MLEIHAQWLVDWKRQLAIPEFGKLKSYEMGPTGLYDQDATPKAIADLKARIAMIEDPDKQYRP